MNIFHNMSQMTATQLANQFGTPLFVIDEAGVVDRFREFVAAVTACYENTKVAISYKTNFTKGLLTLLHEHGAHAEVVSGIEYALAKNIRQSSQIIIFNGPMKTQEEIIQAILDGAYINCDHEDEIYRIESIAKMMHKKVDIGLRIYFPENNSWNRFGFAVDENIEKLIQKINQSEHIQIKGLHAHIGTNIRDIRQYRRLAERLNEFAQLLKYKYALELSWIDVGGGLAGISPARHENRLEPHLLPDLKAYADAITKPLLPYLNALANKPLLIFEPGRTIFEAFGALLTRVVGTRPAHDNMSAYICDAGINSLATSYAYDFPINYFQSANTTKKSILYGPTCNQADQLHSPLRLPMLNVNDLLLFYGVGSYCMAFSYSFIRFKPGIVGINQGKPHWLRLPESIEHHSRLDRLPKSIAQGGER